MIASAVSVAALGVGGLVAITTVAGAGEVVQPTSLTITMSLGPATVGRHYSVGVTAAASGIIGCYHWVATGLPDGLTLAPSTTCVSAMTSSISTTIAGVPALSQQAEFAHEVTVEAFAVGTATAPQPIGPSPAGSASATLMVLPKPWILPSVADSYANTGLTAVSCVDYLDCWVMGSSSNPTPPLPAVAPPTGMADETVTIGIPSTSRQLHVIPGGTFVATILGISPLRLGVKRIELPGGLTAMACSDSATCLFVGSTSSPQGTTVPLVVEMTDSGAHWTTIEPTLPSLFSSGTFSSVTCSNLDDCLLGGYGTTTSVSSVSGGFVASVHPQSSPGVTGPIISVASLAKKIDGVACENASVCLVVGFGGKSYNVTSSARILKSVNGGATWIVDQRTTKNPGSSSAALQPWIGTVDGPLVYGELETVGCARGTGQLSCDTVWEFWPAGASTSDGVHWLPNVETVDGGGSPSGPLSCPETGHCFGVANSTFLCAYGAVCHTSTILETIPKSAGWEWGLAGEGPSQSDNSGLAQVSCATIDTCVAVGSWQPLSSAPWSPIFPLVMSPQIPNHPFFRAPPPPPTLLTTTNLALVIGLVSMATGVGGVLDVGVGAIAGATSLVTGVGSAVMGAPACFHGDWLGCASVVFGGIGLSSFGLGAFSYGLGLADVATSSGAPAAPIVLPEALSEVPTSTSTGEGLLESAMAGGQTPGPLPEPEAPGATPSTDPEEPSGDDHE